MWEHFCFGIWFGASLRVKTLAAHNNVNVCNYQNIVEGKVC